MEKFLEQEVERSAATPSQWILRVKDYFGKFTDMATSIQEKLGFSPREMIILAGTTTAVLTLLSIFVFWGFKIFTRENIR